MLDDSQEAEGERYDNQSRPKRAERSIQSLSRNGTGKMSMLRPLLVTHRTKNYW